MRFTAVVTAIVGLTGVYGNEDYENMCGTRTDGGFPTWCPTEYVPVCALCPNNKLTNYMNMCFFNAAKCDRARDDWCELKHHGSCSDYDSHSHSRCSTLYNPVCTTCGEALTLRTFINECYYYQYNDENPEYMRCSFKNSGECNNAKAQATPPTDTTTTTVAATNQTPPPPPPPPTTVPTTAADAAATTSTESISETDV